MLRHNREKRNGQRAVAAGREDCCGQRRQDRRRQQKFLNRDRDMETMNRTDKLASLDKESLLNKKEELLIQLDEVNLDLTSL